MDEERERNVYAPPVTDVSEPALAVPAARGLADGPRGIGGWLLLPLLGLILSPIRIVHSLLTEYVPVFQQDWATIMDEGYADYHPLWGPLLVYETVGSLAVGFASVVALSLMLRHDRRLPKLVIAIYAATCAFLATDLLVASQIPALAGADPNAFRDLTQYGVGTAIWIPYFLVSKRVRNTFVK